jgi:hypothetical protein
MNKVSVTFTQPCHLSALFVKVLLCWQLTSFRHVSRWCETCVAFTFRLQNLPSRRISVSMICTVQFQYAATRQTLCTAMPACHVYKWYKTRCWVVQCVRSTVQGSSQHLVAHCGGAGTLICSPVVSPECVRLLCHLSVFASCVTVVCSPLVSLSPVCDISWTRFARL